ncbi:helix-turn-helix domain-containing protein [Salinarchaeum sp. IM2453]|uniref:helix-turn-helix domain-containing protein n=1 Tax=Salinarchaeum sp. IM2453 TaxID=2862870 RepID=UPI001C82E7E2|nr:helix-turn-helix domain-containing protein [Salinarchaeum sp. IM2453]QZA87586.1 helix-turn-helix domain-containing protein [Salinarchaeum sp. IM2453]
MSGLRVELEIGSPKGCPIAETTANAGESVTEITWTHSGDDVTEQFTTRSKENTIPDIVDPVFEYNHDGVYEFNRETEGCPCSTIEEQGYPISDARSENGNLYVTLHLADRSALSSLLKGLKQQYDDVSIQTISQADADDQHGGEFVPINRGELTQRQREVIETAYEMGYFKYPRQANATEVAEELDICPSTLAEHMAAAQSKIYGDLFGISEIRAE